MNRLRILVTAGPTREYLDPVRFLGNRSSGKMGYALAAAAQAAGHEVRLIHGPVSIAAPPDVALIGVESAGHMLKAVLANVDWCDVLIMAAAVADWRPVRISETKLKKEKMPSSIELERTVDILATVAPLKKHRIFIGFAAETGDVVRYAAEKLRRKNLDMIVANDVSAPDSGFEVDTNRVVLITQHAVRHLDLMPKRSVAEKIVACIDELIDQRRA